MMKCINHNCGRDVLTEDNELCHNCNEIKTIIGMRSKIQLEHNHERDSWRACKECCRLNIQIKSRVCENCGESRYNNHRLCYQCVTDTLPCGKCNGKNRTTHSYIKVCTDCITGNTECIYVECTNVALKDSSVCQLHCCKNHGCLNIINGHQYITSGNQYNTNYCKLCVCPDCDKVKINKNGCIDHTCKYDGCDERTSRNSHKACDAHTCSNSNCSYVVVKYGKYCSSHSCTIKNCFNHVKQYYHDRAIYCTDHSCNDKYCLDIKYKDRMYCASHLCSVEGCNRDSYGYTCCFHTISRVKCWHTKGNYKKNSIMEISKLITMGHKFDKKLLWRQLYKSNNNFYIGFQKLGYSLLYALKLNGVCKDIREVIFFEYLVATIRHYFGKRCSDCVMICSKEKCGMIGLPYDPECKMHVCSKDSCSKLRYKALNICIEHKCKHCTKEIHNKTKFCRKHLCPICNVNCIADGYNFCRMCRCSTRVKNNYGTIRCVNPIYGVPGGKVCLEHKE